MPLAVIQVDKLSKQYRLGEVGTGTIRHDLNRLWYKARGKEDPYRRIGDENDRSLKGSDYVWALKEVSFNVNHGDIIGIIGRNGAGKSTLLKILSRTTAPTSGSVKVKGRIASLLEVGTGFNPELTGRDNIYLNGAILGMTRREIDRKFDEIVAFAGVERYVDTPVKRYSSGMYVRLAFGVAAHLEPEILVVDEVLAVGDAEFQKKALGKMQDISRGEGRTVLFVSHNMGSVNQLCNRGIVLDRGRIIFDGGTREAIQRYNLLGVRAGTYTGPETSDKKMWFKSIRITNNRGEAAGDIFHDQEIVIEYTIGSNLPLDSHSYNLFLMILNDHKQRVCAAESDIIRSETIRFVIAPNFLVRGEYSLHTFIHKPRTEALDTVEDNCSFSVIDNGSILNIHGNYDYGNVFAQGQWKQQALPETTATIAAQSS